MKRWLLLLSLLLVPTLLMAADEEQAKGGEPQYVNLSPAFVVNVKRGTGARFLQVKADVLVNSKEDAKLVELHMPLIRHTMIMTLSDRDGRRIRTIQMREQLRSEAEEAIRKALKEATGKEVIQGLFFTDFVVQ
ncbi:MAG: flagellar basal body protein FliL [Gammaproteobacteria bacterium]|nr:MAG: flagellar basal body protein FliL [Gammaproteobacteria bacterium]